MKTQKDYVKKYQSKPEVKKQMAVTSKRYIRKQKELVYEHYGKICVCCGESNEKFLSIDHINNDGAKQRRTRTSGLYRDIINNRFPNDIQILCMNCNWAKGQNGGICPHEDNC